MRSLFCSFFFFFSFPSSSWPYLYTADLMGGKKGLDLLWWPRSCSLSPFCYMNLVLQEWLQTRCISWPRCLLIFTKTERKVAEGSYKHIFSFEDSL